MNLINTFLFTEDTSEELIMVSETCVHLLLDTS